MTRTPTLTAKQARFAAEYTVDLNATAAAQRAGYSANSARRIGSDLLKVPHVLAEVQRLTAIQLDRAELKAEDVLKQLKRIAMFDVATIYEWRSVPYLIDDLEKWRKYGGHRYKCGCPTLIESEEMLAKGCGEHGPGTEIVFPLTVAVKERRMLHPADWPDQSRTALSSMDTVIRNLTSGDGFVDTVLKVKLESKLQALELLAKHMGLLTERVEVDQHMTITWLPPEPLPTVETIDAGDPTGPPHRLAPWTPGSVDPTEPMGFPAAPPAPSHRTVAPIFSESGNEPSSAMTEEERKRREEEDGIRFSGVSRRAQEKMFPEMRSGPLKRR